MGARVVFNIKQADGYYVSLYSHWGETSALGDLAYAIEKARPRWQDETYACRIIISQLIGSEWDEETGYGLWASNEPFTDETSYEIDLAGQTVSGLDGTHTFTDFARYHGKVSA